MLHEYESNITPRMSSLSPTAPYVSLLPGDPLCRRALNEGGAPREGWEHWRRGRRGARLGVGGGHAIRVITRIVWLAAEWLT